MFVRGCKLVVAIALCLTIAGVLLATGAAPAPAAALAEKHPKIRAALADLRDARDELQNAATDFGGHKKAAIEAVQVAIDQLKVCLESD